MPYFLLVHKVTIRAEDARLHRRLTITMTTYNSENLMTRHSQPQVDATF